ncbi:hypothetical protein [Bradyrhizobium sp.]|uniref:hypothetical protein n=1 Tax=Bradyrhizobium sp. TaxID=376 RepID=UPI004038166D
MSHFNAGRYRESAHWQARALAEHPSSTWIHATLCPAYGLGGQKSEAEHSLHLLRREYPDLTVEAAMAAYPPVSAAYRERCARGPAWPRLAFMNPS